MRWQQFNPFDGDLRQKLPYVLGGALVGVLGLWVALKILTPVVRSICKLVATEETSTRGRGTREVPVEAIVVKQGTISRRVVTVGKIRANNEVVLKAELHGRITEILFQEGTEVKKGDPLIKFDDLDTQAQLKQAEAELAFYAAEHRRITTLHDKNIQSVKQMDEIKAKRDGAEAKVEEAKATLAKKNIIAPFEGTIGLIKVSPGAYVQSGQDLVTLVDSTPIRIDFKVPEKHIHDIGPGQVAEIMIDGFKDQIFHFTVDAIDSRIEEQSHSIAVRASNPNEANLLRVGLFANVSLIIGDKGDAIIVPEASVYREGDIEYVWIVENGKAGRARIVTGTRENGKIEIIGGRLKPGSIVVTVGQIRLADGVKVKITNMPEMDLTAESRQASEAYQRTLDEKKDFKDNKKKAKESSEEGNKPAAEEPKEEAKASPEDSSSDKEEPSTERVN